MKRVISVDSSGNRHPIDLCFDHLQSIFVGSGGGTRIDLCGNNEHSILVDHCCPVMDVVIDGIVKHIEADASIRFAMDAQVAPNAVMFPEIVRSLEDIGLSIDMSIEETLSAITVAADTGFAIGIWDLDTMMEQFCDSIHVTAALDMEISDVYVSFAAAVEESIDMIIDVAAEAVISRLRMIQDNIDDMIADIPNATLEDWFIYEDGGGGYLWNKYELRHYFDEVSTTTTTLSKFSSYPVYQCDYQESGTVDVAGSDIASDQYLIYNGQDMKATVSRNFLRAYTVLSYRVGPAGEPIDTVYSRDETAYPENGEQDGYWYVRV